MSMMTTSVFKQRLPELLTEAVHEAPWQLPNNHIVIGIEAVADALDHFFVGDEQDLVQFIEFLIRDAKRRNTYYPIHIETRFTGERMEVPSDPDELADHLLEAAVKCNLFEAMAVFDTIEDESVIQHVLKRLAARTDMTTEGHGKELAHAYGRFSAQLDKEERWRLLTQTVQTVFKAIFAELSVAKASWGRIRFLGEVLRPLDMEIIPREEMAEDDERTLLVLVRSGDGRKAMWYVDEVWDPEDEELQTVCMIRAIESVGARRHCVSSCRSAMNLTSDVHFVDSIFMWRGILEFFLSEPEPSISCDEFEAMIQSGREQLPPELTVQEIVKLSTEEAIVAASVRYLESGEDIKPLYSALLMRAMRGDRSVHLVNVFNCMYRIGEKLGDPYRRYALARVAWETVNAFRRA
ncbi:MAG TPA: hypothetical protein VFV52_12875 [Bacilli bacterium]|nr:hypothetical protein [Bacilli bacterium]